MVTLPKITVRDLRRWSPISAHDRQQVEAAIGRLDSGAPSPEQLQRVVAPLRAALEAVRRTTVCGHLEIGRWLVQLKARTSHGSFTGLFRGSRNAIAEPLPLDLKTAEALMRVVSHPVLGDPRRWPSLPVESLSVMDALSRLAQRRDLGNLIDRGLVHRHTTRREAMALRSDTTADPLQQVRSALRFYHGPRAALRDLLRATLADLDREPDDDQDDDDDDDQNAEDEDDDDDEEDAR